MKKFFAVILAFVMVLTLAACNGGAGSSPAAGGTTSTPGAASTPAPAGEPVPPVKIGVSQILSGQYAEPGTHALDGLTLAVQHINDAGGIKSLGGAKIEMVIQDATSDPTQAKNVVERMVMDEEIICWFGPSISAVMLSTLPVLEKNGIPLITDASGDALFEQGFKYIFCITHRGFKIGANVAACLNWLNTEKGFSFHRVGIVYENSAAGIPMAEGARKNLANYGLEIAFDESFPPGLTDASSIVTAMKNSEVEVFNPSTYAAESKLFIDTMNSQDFHPLIVGPVAWPSLGENLGSAVNGVLSTANWNAHTKAVQDNPKWKAVVEEFEATHSYFMDEKAGPNYQCGMILWEALEATGSRDREVLAEYLRTATFENTMMSPPTIKFGDDGNNGNAAAVIHQWQDGVPYAVFPREYAVREFVDPTTLSN